jgi:cytidylate kinase
MNSNNHKYNKLYQVKIDKSLHKLFSDASFYKDEPMSEVIRKFIYEYNKKYEYLLKIRNN